MELLPEDGSTPPIPVNSALFLGRGSAGVCSGSDLTVSRRHLSLSPANPPGGGDPRLQFEVVGRNPVVVVRGAGGRSDGEQRRIVRPSEKGELRTGDRVSLSLKNPMFLRVEAASAAGGVAEADGVEEGVLDAVRRREERTEKRRKMTAAAEEAKKEEMVRRSGEEDGRIGEDVWASGGGDEEVRSAADLDFGFEPLDTTEIDAVREFGLLVRGHELDMYPRKKVRAVKDWDWFLEDDKGGEESDDEDEGTPTRRRKSASNKRRKKAHGDDEEWTGESEEDKEVVAKGGVLESEEDKEVVAKRGVARAGTSTKRIKYATRSSDPKTGKKRSLRAKKGGTDGPAAARGGDDDVFRDADEDEEDETLGGFIVDDEEADLEEEEEEEDEDEEDEEEEFEEDEEEDE